ncbi:MAG: NADH-quinone oxidoreductase subunit NuoF [Acidimicrobiia bacterium]|nr:NADH-quinone oxidoreductase subunit NuoF [Acidimicrobiia bacterium]
MTYAWSEASEERARQIIGSYPEPRSAMMPLLYIAMKEDLDRGADRLTEDGMRRVADLVGVTPAQVVAVASFYTMYKRDRVGRYLVSVCTSLSCWLDGADDVLHAVESEAGVPSGHTDRDGTITPEHVECIGACGGAPAVQVNYEFVEGVTPSGAREMVRWLRSEEPETVTGDELQARFGGRTAFPWAIPEPAGVGGPVPACASLGTAVPSNGLVPKLDTSETAGNGDLPMILTGRMNQHPLDSHALATYEATGGYSALRKVLGDPGMTPAEITEDIKASMLRGRGGAGFPAGVKWSFLAPPRPSYLVVNADESEPGTFKDRQLMERDPHQMIEGVIISSYATEVNHAFVYVRGEYPKATRRVEAAVEEAYRAGYLGRDILGSGYDLELTVHLGAGAYICGEETALLNSLEGKRGEPRLKPPYFPAAKGLYMMPTIVNNVETLSNVPWIIMAGGAAYAAIGPEGSPGKRMCSISGHVNRPGNYEIVEGLTWRELIFDLAGGIRDGNRLKAWVPGGASAPWFVPELHLDTEVTKEAIDGNGSMTGSGAVIVMDHTTDMVAAAERLVRFFAHESCGQCTPCREGTVWIDLILRRIMDRQGRPVDADLLLDVSDNISPGLRWPPAMTTICPLGPSAVSPVVSLLQYFRDEVNSYLEQAELLEQANLVPVSIGGVS